MIGYQGMLIEMAREYVVLTTSQSQTLMCGGQMSCNRRLLESWAPVEPEIVWNPAAALDQASAAKPADRQQQHYVAVSQFAEESPEPMNLQPALPQRNPGMQQPQQHESSPGPSPDEESHGQDNANAKEAAAKSKKRFRIFRSMRNVIKSHFRK